MTLELFLLLSSLLSLGIYIALDKWEKESQKALVDQPYKDKFFLALDARILQLIEALHQRDRCIQIMREVLDRIYQCTGNQYDCELSGKYIENALDEMNSWIRLSLDSVDRELRTEK